jgi:6-phosphogluconolactonase
MREIVSPDPVERVVADLVSLVEQQSPSDVHIALTGGRAGELVTAQLLAAVADRRNVHLWFSDERFVPGNDEQRNDRIVPSDLQCHVHRVPGSDQIADASSAASAYAATLHQYTTTRFCSDNTLMDVTLLSIGPDGHVASLFPGHASLTSTAGVIAVSDSPKPPPVRVTWTYPTINASREVWLLAVGSEKQEAVHALRTAAPIEHCPATGVHGKNGTRLYTDVPAGA